MAATLPSTSHYFARDPYHGRQDMGIHSFFPSFDAAWSIQETFFCTKPFTVAALECVLCSLGCIRSILDLELNVPITCPYEGIRFCTSEFKSKKSELAGRSIHNAFIIHFLLKKVISCYNLGYELEYSKFVLWLFVTGDPPSPGYYEEYSRTSTSQSSMVDKKTTHLSA